VTLLELMTAKVVAARGRDKGGTFDVLRSVPEAMRASEVVLQWSIATVQGSERDVAFTREYAEFWGKGERQAERDRARVRALLSAIEFERLVRALARYMEDRGLTRPADVSYGVEVPQGVRGLTDHDSSAAIGGQVGAGSRASGGASA
jgi:hypothetical protein